MKKYIGIIDNLGVDNFIPEGELPLTMVKMRAWANLHRNPIVYECYPTKKQEETIKKLFEKGHYSMAEYAIKSSRKYKVLYKGGELNGR